MKERLLPKKSDHRQRAHSNPFSDFDIDVPTKPSDVVWDLNGKPDFIDIGCGFGGLTIDIARDYPEKRIVAMEIRQKVSEFVILKIKGLRQQESPHYQNCQAMRMNCMKFLPNLFEKQSLEKIFILFADPHFKKKKFKHRIITETLLSEYAYILKEHGILYTATDVEALHAWNVKHLDSHSLFEKLTDEEMDNDPMKKYILESTEEGKKVARNGGSKYFAFYRRIRDPFYSK
eukprot:NODE_581_length_5739_cov_0.670922.p4 type:complete len:232 gc:universal NODE_581_length_5739_cov_0.670922:2007-2702(+)